MYIAEIHRRPIASPRPRTPAHVPDSGSGLIVLSFVILLLAIIRKKFGWFQRHREW
jgi:hypothetical protein